MSGHKNWAPAWREPEPKNEYDVIIVGGGGHGLATAYYLAKEHGITNVAVLEKSWLGSGNIGRNTTIIRSNYLLPGNNPFYEWSMKLWEGLEQDFNFNAMVSQRGVLNLFHTDPQRDAFARRGNAMRHRRRRCRTARSRRRCARWCRFSISTMRAFRCRAACCSGAAARCAMMRSPGAMRAAPTAAASTSSRIAKSPASRSRTARSRASRRARGFIGCKKLGARGGRQFIGSRAPWPGMKLPIESHVLQAFVSEGLKPYIDSVVTFGAGHFYVSQSDKGGLVFGGDLDGYNSYARRGNLPMVEHVIEARRRDDPRPGAGAGAALLGRHHGHVDGRLADHRQDAISTGSISIAAGAMAASRRRRPRAGASPIRSPTNETHKLNAAFRLDRFRRGYMIDEKGQGATPNLH